MEKKRNKSKTKNILDKITREEKRNNASSTNYNDNNINNISYSKYKYGARRWRNNLPGRACSTIARKCNNSWRRGNEWVIRRI